MTYYLQFGRLQELSLYEFHQLFPEVKCTKIIDDVFQVEFDDEKLLIEQLQKSGGIIKAMSLISAIGSADRDDINLAIAEYLRQIPRPNFSLTEINRPQRSALDERLIKNVLRQVNVPSRFIHSTAKGLSASVLLHQKVEDLFIIYQKNECVLAKTIWIQDIDDWSNRDVGKPYRDHKRGMIPTKLARMMVNFLSPELVSQQNKRLLDPFCGTGTILMEAGMLDWQVLGSDKSQEAVFGSAENMHWFSNNYKKPEPASLFVEDASNITLKQILQPVDAIVTEPFLGKQTPAPHELPNIFRGLEKQYLGALKQWTNILKKGGEVVVVTPLVKTEKHNFSLQGVIDKSKRFGYDILSGPLIYQRPQTIVQRAIYHLKLK